MRELAIRQWSGIGLETLALLSGIARLDFGGALRTFRGWIEAAVEVQLIIATDPPVLTGLAVLGDGTFQFAFTSPGDDPVKYLLWWSNE